MKIVGKEETRGTRPQLGKWGKYRYQLKEKGNPVIYEWYSDEEHEIGDEI